MDYGCDISVDGKVIRTLRDILPEPPGLRMLIVGKVPAPVSVSVGHYFQGKQGTMFWNRLVEYGLLERGSGFEDEALLSQGYGLTDIVKVPREYGQEPTDEEYRAGAQRILDLNRLHRPRVTLFVYKGVLDRLLSLHLRMPGRAVYGENAALAKPFACRVFVFPMPGTPCTTHQSEIAMTALVAALKET